MRPPARDTESAESRQLRGWPGMNWTSMAPGDPEESCGQKEAFDLVPNVIILQMRIYIT